MNSGALTPGETASLDRGQASVQAGEAAAKADGKVTKRERLALTRAQNHQSRKIYRLKHNPRTTTPAS
jgi:phage terminase Nu1 subunit (DNA packaging protein)